MNPPLEWPIDGEDRLDGGDEAVEVGHVVDAGSIEVAARVRRAPEAVPAGVGRAVRIRIQEAALCGRRSDMEVPVVAAPRGAVGVEQDQERRRRAGLIRRRNVDRHRSIAADDDVRDSRRGGRGRDRR